MLGSAKLELAAVIEFTRAVIGFTRFAWLAVFVVATAAHASLTISDGATKHVNCSAGVCTAQGPNAVLNATDLVGMLAKRDVTATAGNGAVDIAVASALSWTSAHRLTLDAAGSVSVAAPVVVAGPGALTLTTGGGDGALSFSGGSVEFWDLGSSLIIDGQPYTLAGGIAMLAQAIAAAPSGFHALAKDYDAAPDGPYADSPIAAFAGVFEGLGHTISNFHLSDIKAKRGVVNNVGLFATSDGTIRDIALNGAETVAGGKFEVWAGTLVGLNRGAVLQASATGTMSEVDPTTAGGLVGANEGRIVRSSAAVTLNAMFTSGGLVGINRNNGQIVRCHADGFVNASLKYANTTGGLVGQNWDTTSTISLSYSTAQVQGTEFVGGLVGFNHGVVSESFSQGPIVDSHGEAGGLIGINAGPVSNSYSIAPVTAGQDAIMGGLIGETFDLSVVSQTYAAGTLDWDAPHGLGGVDGWDHSGTAEFANTYWDMTRTGVDDPAQGVGNIPNEPGVAGLTHAQLKAALPPGFDPAAWGRRRNLNGGLPYLLANPPPQ